ncbi:MAG: DUF3592 domain-containing protein [Patescibacteria group bacterium]|nr:DUF3592 domain-containing protein [Patescibacteria group bacterium]
MRIKKLKASAQQFLTQYETKDPATYAAAEQAIGGLLLLDGFIGIDNPFGQKSRPGLLGSLLGIGLGIVFLFVPVIFNSISGINKMTATTTATVVSIKQEPSTDGSSGSACSAVTKYSVDGKQYQQPSSYSSSALCGLAVGTDVPINYNPDKPGSWGYNVSGITNIVKIFPFAGALAIIGSLITFVIRLASIIFGYKLLMDGRKRAKTLPQGTDLSALIAQVRHEFQTNIFHQGNSMNPLTQFTDPVPQATTPIVSSPVQAPINTPVNIPTTSATPLAPASPQTITPSASAAPNSPVAPSPPVATPIATVSPENIPAQDKQQPLQ